MHQRNLTAGHTNNYNFMGIQWITAQLKNTLYTVDCNLVNDITILLTMYIRRVGKIWIKWN